MKNVSRCSMFVWGHLFELLMFHVQEKDKGTRLAYVAPTIPRRLASTSDIDEKENR